MWTREELKSLAKESLKGNYLKAFLIALVLTFVGGGGGNSIESKKIEEFLSRYVGNYRDVFIIVGAIVILSIAFRLLLGYSLEVGSRRYFVKLGQFKNTDGCYSFAFDNSNYKGIVITMLLKDVYLVLWTFLFIIPGIVKAYSYRMVPFILADNPNIGPNEAITLSRKMMDGHKFSSFVLDLSFIGWIILGILAFGVGIYFVNPYIFATEAQLYITLRKNAIDYGYCTYKDLNIEEENNFTNFNENDYNNF